MSYHGGVIGGVLGSLFWTLRNKYDFREICDMFGLSIPLGYTFGRIGNFINAELYGRVTASPAGMIFPIPEWDLLNRFSPKLKWVREIAEQTGIETTSALVNLPRHPSQLYEALFEGVVLWFLLWIFRKKSPFKGFMFGAYIAGYGVIRFIIEYFREPDAELGYKIQLGEQVAIKDIAHLHPLLSFSTGQILCMLMILSAVLWWIISYKAPGSKAQYYCGADAPFGIAEESKISSQKNRSKSARKKLKRKK